MAQALTVSGVVLPGGEHRDVHVRDGRIAAGPAPEATRLGPGWIVPGLVDAHCHIGIDRSGGVGADVQVEQAIANRDVGALLLRDCGTVPDTHWIDDREDLPRIVRCGRHIARTRRYTPGFAHEVEPDQLVDHMSREAKRGDGWVKIVADWIDRSVGDLTPAWPREALCDGIAAAHDLGAKVTAHVFGERALVDLLDARVDCIEHGTGLHPDLHEADLIAQMVDQGTAYDPTVLQLNNFLEFADQGAAKFPVYAAHMRDLYARRRETVVAAYEAGVPIYAGTDAGGVRPHGTVVEEIAELEAYGLSAFDALGAGSWRARAWLGHDDRLVAGADADFVVYDADPLEDLSVLERPTAVVLRGKIVS